MTSRVVLGCVATSVGERHPAILAKTVAALDVCSAGRALACLAPRAVPLETGLDELAEALDVVRTMLDRPAPSYAGRHFAIEGAWNEPRAARVTPTPVGVLVPAAAATGDVALVSPGEFASLAARHADCCFVEVSNGDARTLRDVSRALATTDIPVIALIGATGDATPGDVASASAARPRRAVPRRRCRLVADPPGGGGRGGRRGGRPCRRRPIRHCVRPERPCGVAAARCRRRGRATQPRRRQPLIVEAMSLAIARAPFPPIGMWMRSGPNQPGCLSASALKSAIRAFAYRGT